VIPKCKFHIRFGLFEASRLNRDSRVLSRPVPAVISQPELAFNARQGVTRSVTPWLVIVPPKGNRVRKNSFLRLLFNVKVNLRRGAMRSTPCRLSAVRTALIKFKFESGSRPSSSHRETRNSCSVLRKLAGPGGTGPWFPVAVIQKVFHQRYFHFPECRLSTTGGRLNRKTTFCLIEDHRTAVDRISKRSLMLRLSTSLFGFHAENTHHGFAKLD